MTLEDLGYHPELDKYRKEQALESFDVGRVISEHKERYVVKTADKEYEGEIVGNLRYTSHSRSDFPAIGDWVAISAYDENKVLIHHVYPRKTILERQAVGKQGEKQIIATNIDYAFIVQAVDSDFNINRAERYLTICHASRIDPIIILNKIDLISEEELAEKISAVQDRIKGIPVVPISSEKQLGIDALRAYINESKTYCMLGSSGVGKSTLINTLAGKQVMRTNVISTSTNKGQHTTSHRELLVLENGGILIDNPGMREVGIADSSEGLDLTFAAILELSKECKFSDCSHTVESGCAVLEAVESGEIDNASYNNYLRMEREKEHYISSIAEKRQKDKDFGKMVKEYKKLKKSKKP